MSKIDYLASVTISRRTFLKGAMGTAAAVALVGSAGGLLVGCKKKEATADITVTSTLDFNHSHNIIVLGADIDKPPATKTITSDGASHTHDVALAKADYEAIGKGQAVSKVSTSSGTTPHTHTFNIKKA
ncbi:MAG: twin-arginine translocation signal domain-containing protein [Chloroflexi bacterium]|nr:twin-arginine translocation signal domain-containing protein [Chloroflexota bacterium]